MSPTRRILFVTTLAVAVYILVVPFALSLFSRTRDAQRLSDYYRPVMSAQGLGQFHTGLEIVNAGGKELYGKVLPQLEGVLHLDGAQFNTFVEQNYPHVAAFLKRAPETVKYLNPATQQVLAQKDNFHDADQFPVANLPVTVGPWALLFLGFALIGVAVFIRSSKSVVPIVAVLVVGIGLVVGPVALGWFHETDAADQVAQVARGPFSPQLANTTVDDTFSFNAALQEMRRAMFPAIARQLGLSDAQMDAYLHTNFPATMKFLDTWDKSIYTGARKLSLSQVRFMDEFHNADATPYRALPWVFIVPGLILAVAGGFGLARRRREET